MSSDFTYVSVTFPRKNWQKEIEKVVRTLQTCRELKIYRLNKYNTSYKKHHIQINHNQICKTYNRNESFQRR